MFFSSLQKFFTAKGSRFSFGGVFIRLRLPFFFDFPRAHVYTRVGVVDFYFICQ